MNSPLTGPVHVIGAGLIGTSIALALRRAGVDVTLEDSSSENLNEAIGMGAGRALTVTDEPELVVVAVPPRASGTVMAEATSRYPRATITDVASVKTVVLEDARLGEGNLARIVGGHPMAGRESSGPKGARADLLDDKLWVITPLAGNSEEDLLRVHRLVTTCGAYAVEMSPEEHDRAVALISHVPQLISSALAAQLASADESHVRLTGTGLRDMTRIAGSNSQMWSDIVAGNSVPIRDALSALMEQLRGLEGTLNALASDPSSASAVAGVEELLRTGAVGKARIPGKHGAADSPYALVPVMVSDQPGSLAQLFLAAGELGINLEDVSIEHVLGRPSGVVDLYVHPAASAALREGLTSRGFDVRA
jgi:prephenate dehydrogenase